MKKVLITHTLKPLLMRENGLLNRSDVAVYTAKTNDDVLKIHIEENVNLIVAEFGAPGIGSETLFDIIRKGETLRTVSVLMVCEDIPGHWERCKQCGANAVVVKPADPAELYHHMQRLIDIAPRHAYRVALNVAVEGKFNNRPFLCRTENISASGMLIKAEEKLDQGDRIFSSFFLPDGTHVSGRGEIVRMLKQATAPEALYGIMFKDLTPGVRTAIETFTKKN